MGLLDDAIRDHLELKRSRGADPEELARAEHEALEPVFPDEPAGPEQQGDSSVVGDGSAGQEQQALDPRLADFSSIGQETAEIDMEAVLAEDAGAGPVQPDVPGQERLDFE